MNQNIANYAYRGERATDTTLTTEQVYPHLPFHPPGHYAESAEIPFRQRDG